MQTELTAVATVQAGDSGATLPWDSDASNDSASPAQVSTGASGATQVKPRRFHGSIALDPMRLARDAGTISQEVLQHLISLVGAKAKVTLEIEVDSSEGFPDSTVRTVLENCRTLKFEQQGFEDD